MGVRRINILIGNGINRTFNDSHHVEDYYSSENLFRHLVNRYNLDLDLSIKSKPSFPILFESIIGLVAKQSISIDDVFKETRKYLFGLNTSTIDVYKHLDICVIKNIITTNYDFAIEYNLFKPKSKDIKPTAIKVNGGKKTIFNNVPIYHIHGVIQGSKDKICLGNISYNNFCRSLQSNIPSSYTTISKTPDKYIKKLPDWARLFFYEDIHIIGLNLTSDEKDLWYLLNLRAYLKQTTNIIKNNIYYYTKISNEKFNKIIYSGLEIELVPLRINRNNYKRAYIKVLDKLANE